eukprot:jgi/Botrbrau1/20536/Bobra.145_2s0085.1
MGKARAEDRAGAEAGAEEEEEEEGDGEDISWLTNIPQILLVSSLIVTLDEMTPQVQKIFSAAAQLQKMDVHAMASANPLGEDLLGAAGQFNENSGRVIKLLEKPDALTYLQTQCG